MGKNTIFTDEQKRAFCLAADPHQWFLTAYDLHQQAFQIHEKRKSSGILILRDRHSLELDRWRGGDRAAYLLAAFAIENLLKACLVHENPSLIAGGYLRAEIASHDLVRLYEQSSFEPKSADFACTLRHFSEGNESWMRYPCGRNALSVSASFNFDENIWRSYCDLVSSLVSYLTRRLGEGWEHPYEGRVSWIIPPDYFGLGV